MKSFSLTAVLDDGLDELAASSHAGSLQRVAVNIIIAGVFTMVLPWRICAVWGCVTVALEIVFWLNSRPQFLGRPASWRRPGSGWARSPG